MHACGLIVNAQRIDKQSGRIWRDTCAAHLVRLMGSAASARSVHPTQIEEQQQTANYAYQSYVHNNYDYWVRMICLMYISVDSGSTDKWKQASK